MNGAAVSSGMGTCGLVGPIGIITGWFSPSQQAVDWAVHRAGGSLHQAAEISQETLAHNPNFLDWLGLVLVCFILPGVITWLFGLLERKLGWIKEGDLLLPQ